MTLQQIVYFCEIAKTLHFTRASENLFVSQSSMSHSILALERELSVPLFTRQAGKKIALTYYGEQFLPYAQSILKTVDDSKEHLNKIQDPLSGVVRIAYGYVNGISVISRLFKAYYADNTNRNISIQFQINNGRKKIEQSMLAGETDLAFTATKSFPGLNCLPVTTQELVVMLPKDHPLSCRPSLTVADISSEPLLVYHRGGNLVQHINAMFAESGYRPNITEFLEDWLEEVAYISLGLGIGISPRIPVSSDEISIVPLDHPQKYRSLYLCWPKDTPLSPATEYVRQYCIRYFQAAESSGEN